MDAIRKQIGGSHYQARKIQPVEYIMANRLGFAEGNVIKYVSRWEEKGGVEDLRKAAHYLEFLIEFAENDGAVLDGDGKYAAPPAPPEPGFTSTPKVASTARLEIRPFPGPSPRIEPEAPAWTGPKGWPPTPRDDFSYEPGSGRDD